MIGLGIIDMVFEIRDGPALLFIVGLLAAAVPWLLHNYLQSGTWTLERLSSIKS